MLITTPMTLLFVWDRVLVVWPGTCYVDEAGFIPADPLPCPHLLGVCLSFIYSCKWFIMYSVCECTYHSIWVEVREWLVGVCSLSYCGSRNWTQAARLIFFIEASFGHTLKFVCVYMCMCGDQSSTSDVILRDAVYLLWDSLLLAWSLLVRLYWLGSEPQGSLHLQPLVLYGCTTLYMSLVGGWWQTQVLMFARQAFYNWAIFPGSSCIPLWYLSKLVVLYINVALELSLNILERGCR